MRPSLLLTVLALATTTAQAQFTLQDSHTTAELRGVYAVSPAVAWASGTRGTVLRTLDGGKTWTPCPVPTGAAKLDFRGIQAWDADTAVVMASGPGPQSAVYKTTDGCQTWKLVFEDPDEKGFFDAILRVAGKQLFLLGDPVAGKFSLFTSRDAGDTWFIADDPGLEAPGKAGAFAASNTSLAAAGPYLAFGTGGPVAGVYTTGMRCDKATGQCRVAWTSHETPLAHGPDGAGIFSLTARFSVDRAGRPATSLVAVGGDYTHPNATAGTAAISNDGGLTWTAATQPPHGYRSAVAWNATHTFLITIGPNGTDISKDGGLTWTPVPASTPEAGQHWNALSLPFAVGTKGRIGILNPTTLP